MYAAEIYAAELEPRDITIGRRAGMLAGSAASIALSLFGMGDSPIGPAVSDLVIRVRDDGRVVYRAGQGNSQLADSMLETAQRELAQFTPERFATEWGLDLA
ncbi:hypothetical protein E3T61_13635 [Cryobacterium lactosi]|uniref:Uncharacterized protein n=1 Tax=Cryobacterium lactosi TaxID=1259202 RepID=A0A4V3IWZ8_9MICO|nr:hypothetical protein [Cryobacterium lactosi]TFD88134.1 hypothetical protein E3T61_13635 [Cryobacterium lactosi]